MSDCSEPFLPDAQQFKSRSSSLSRPSSEICLPVAADNTVVTATVNKASVTTRSSYVIIADLSEIFAIA